MFNFDPLLKKRINAFSLDMAIIVVVNYFLMAAFTDFLKVVFFHFPIQTQILLIKKFKYVHSVSLLSLFFAYFTVFYFATNGKTMGKMLLGLQVCNHNNEDINLFQAMKRSLAYITCAWFASLPFLLPFLRKDHKSLADLFSNTHVEMIEEDKIVQKTEFQLTLLDIKEDETHEESKAA